jgi:hypothetical protein
MSAPAPEEGVRHEDHEAQADAGHDTRDSVDAIVRRDNGNGNAGHHEQQAENDHRQRRAPLGDVRLAHRISRRRAAAKANQGLVGNLGAAGSALHEQKNTGDRIQNTEYRRRSRFCF